jgi:hypothetical protein
LFMWSTSTPSIPVTSATGGRGAVGDEIHFEIRLRIPGLSICPTSKSDKRLLRWIRGWVDGRVFLSRRRSGPKSSDSFYSGLGGVSTAFFTSGRWEDIFLFPPPMAEKIRRLRTFVFLPDGIP